MGKAATSIIQTTIVASTAIGALLVAAGPAQALEIHVTANIQLQGRLIDVVPDGEGFCDYTATVRVRGRTDTGRAVRANRLPFNATAPCDSTLRVGADIRGTGDVDVVGRAGGPKSPIRIERATGFAGFGAETSLFTAPVTLGPVLREFLLTGDLRGRVDKATPMGAGVIEYSLTAQIDGVTADGFRLRQTRYYEATVATGGVIAEGALVEGTINGTATGMTSGRWIEVLSFAGDATFRVAGSDGPPLTGLIGFGAETTV